MTETIQVTYSAKDRMFKEVIEKTTCAGCGRIYGDCDCPAGTITSHYFGRSFPLPDEAEELAKDRFKGLEKLDEALKRSAVEIWKAGFRASKEKYPFSLEDMRNAFKAGAAYADTQNGVYFDAPNEDSFIQSLSPFKEGITYTAEVEDGRITKIVEA